MIDRGLWKEKKNILQVNLHFYGMLKLSINQVDKG